MTQPLLSVVITTYNRAPQLELLLADLSMVMKTWGSKLELVVCDNASTDDTASVLRAHQASWPSTRVVTRPLNLGMEGNIACAMLEGNGKYVWTLSDHQRLCVDGLHRLMELIGEMQFDIGHAKVVQWHSALSVQEQVQTWYDISDRERGALLFSLGNLSTLIYRRELANAAAKTIFKSCFWSYPHLGVISQIRAETRIVEFYDMTSFPSTSHATTMKHDYDKLSVRYRGNFRCTSELAKRAGLTFDPAGFFTRDYRASFRADVLLLLLTPNLTRSSAMRSLVPLLPRNPWSLKATALFVLVACLLFPEVSRLQLAALARARLKRRSSVTTSQA